jgi:D-sedoheptulose 7-phosphate isomerase
VKTVEEGTRFSAHALDALGEHLALVKDLFTLTPVIAEIAAIISKAFKSGGKVLLLGNGGSASDAQHLAAEFVGRFTMERGPYPAIALPTNPSILTAIGNDYGFEHLFARQVTAYGRPGDALVAISTSGNSPNVLSAASEAKRAGITAIGFTGASGGKLKSICDLCICIPSTNTARIQEMHILIGHTICQLVDEMSC